MQECVVRADPDKLLHVPTKTKRAAPTRGAGAKKKQRVEVDTAPVAVDSDATDADDGDTVNNPAEAGTHGSAWHRMRARTQPTPATHVPQQPTARCVDDTQCHDFVAVSGFCSLVVGYS